MCFKAALGIKPTRFWAYIITDSLMSQNADDGEREGSWQRGNGYRETPALKEGTCSCKIMLLFIVTKESRQHFC